MTTQLLVRCVSSLRFATVSLVLAYLGEAKIEQNRFSQWADPYLALVKIPAVPIWSFESTMIPASLQQWNLIIFTCSNRPNLTTPKNRS
jgi:hypothetical protein